MHTRTHMARIICLQLLLSTMAWLGSGCDTEDPTGETDDFLPLKAIVDISNVEERSPDNRLIDEQIDIFASVYTSAFFRGKI